MRNLVTTKNFDKTFIKITKKNQALALEVISALKKLSMNLNDPSLRTHKLSGNLKGFYACSANYSIRIIFKYDESNVYLETLGDHDSVY